MSPVQSRVPATVGYPAADILFPFFLENCNERLILLYALQWFIEICHWEKIDIFIENIKMFRFSGLLFTLLMFNSL